MTLKTYNEWRIEQEPSFLEEAEEYRKWSEKKEDEKHSENQTLEITEKEWLEIKGIGPKLAKRLIELSSLQLKDIEQVKGIKTSVLKNIKDYLLEKSIL